MKAKNIIAGSFAGSLLFLISCTSNFKLNEVLDLAEDNRSELESVINHYAGDPEKLAAAKYFIENMPGHYSFVDTARVERFYDSLDSLLDAMTDCSRKAVQDSITALCKKHDIEHFATVPDIQVISADFLIDNIDRAFEQWRTVPWCRSLDFDQFCEYLLPYKVAETQALKPWRDDYTEIFADSLDRMSSCSLFRISAFQATEVVNNCLKQHFVRDPEDYPIPPLFYRQLTRLRVPFGSCDDLCQAGLSAFRAAGIPAVIDYVPVWGYGNRGHMGRRPRPEWQGYAFRAYLYVAIHCP